MEAKTVPTWEVETDGVLKAVSWVCTRAGRKEIEAQRGNDYVALAGLPPRQRQIVLGLLEGFDQKEIAAKIGIEVRTVKAHLNNLYRKAGLIGDERIIPKVALTMMFARWLTPCQPANFDAHNTGTEGAGSAQEE